MNFQVGTQSFCGLNQAGTTTTVIYAHSSSHCSSAPPGNLKDVIVHELVHTLGFSNALEAKGKPGYSDHCALYLDPNGTVNGDVCQHELELLLSKYGYRDVILGESFWSKHIITGISVSPDTIVASKGATRGATAEYLLSDRGRRGFRPIDNEVVTWASLDGLVATVTADDDRTASVTGVQVGETSLRVETSSPLNSDEMYGGVFGDEGTLVPVVVTPPPSQCQGTNFQVCAIDGPSKPVVDEGPYFFSAVLGNVPYGILSTEWEFDFSLPWMHTIETTDDRPRLYIDGGSYTIEVRVEVTALTGAQAYRTEHWTVCTESGGGGGGGDLLLVPGPLPAGGGAVPQAVEGC